MSTQFEDFDYGTTDYVYNMGSMLIIGTVILIQFPLYYLGKCFANKASCCRKMQNYYAPSQFWSTPIDFMHAGYIELAFSVTMNFYNLVWTSEEYSYGLIINNMYVIFTTVLIIAFPIWLGVFLSKNYENLGEEEF